LFAFERDKERYKTLQKMLKKGACKNVIAVNADFLTINSNDAKYTKVTHM
jgi:putative methyltransferase